MKPFDELLKESSERHGHLCAGQVIGVRMAMLGCKLIGLKNPKSPKQQKRIIVYVEIDRCATDAISTVTGCKLGKRTLKYKDYGIMAATFINTEKGIAYRVSATEESKDLACRYAPQVSNPSRQQLEAYKIMPTEELFRIDRVSVRIPLNDQPGPPRTKSLCQGCGATVRDGKEVVTKGLTLCKACAYGGYYQKIDTLREERAEVQEQRI